MKKLLLLDALHKQMKQMFNKIYTWYSNIENTNVKVIIGGFSMMLFTYLMIYLADEGIPYIEKLIFGYLDWQPNHYCSSQPSLLNLYSSSALTILISQLCIKLQNEKLEWICMVCSDLGNSHDHEFYSVLLWLLGIN